MVEIYAEFDLIDGFNGGAFYYGDTIKEAMDKAKADLKDWGGGHVDMFIDDDFYDDYEY